MSGQFLENKELTESKASLNFRLISILRKASERKKALANLTDTISQVQKIKSKTDSGFTENIPDDRNKNIDIETTKVSTKTASTFCEGVYSVKQLYNMDLGFSWTVDGILPEKGMMILSGSHGLGKSFMALDLSIKMANNSSKLWLDKFKIKSGSVAYIDTENALPLIKRRLKLLGADEDNGVHFLYYPSFNINNENDYKKIVEELRSIAPELIVIDSLRRCHTTNENDAGKMSAVMSKIQSLHPAAKIILHHTCKSGNGLRGSGDLSAVVDSHLQLSRTKSGKNLFTHAKSRWDKAVNSFTVDKVEGDKTLEFVYSDEIEEEETYDKAEVILQTIRDAGGSLSRSEIIKITEIPEKTVERRLKALVSTDVLTPEREGKFMNYKLVDNSEPIEGGE